MILGLKNLTTKLIGSGRTGKSFLPQNVLLKDLKHSTSFVITDPQGVFTTSLIAEYSRIPEKDRKAFLASNNWRKMHGYPVRRGVINKHYKETYTERQILLAWERAGWKFSTLHLDKIEPVHTFTPDYSKIFCSGE